MTLLQLSGKSDIYSFKLHRYYQTHRRLCFALSNVGASDNGSSNYLYFSQTLYFSGLVTWVGKEFYIASKSDLLSFCENREALKEVRAVYEGLEKDSLRFYKLFVFPCEADNLYVIAVTYHLSDQEPE
jgi:hypothetical protein